jgi:O-antigen/teichoic acid export membrane protein
MRTTMKLDLASAYLLTAARVGSWIIVSAIVFRAMGDAAFGMFALGRSTVGLLAYSALGLGPAMMRRLAEAMATRRAGEPPRGGVLDYQTTQPTAFDTVHSSGAFLALGLGAVGALLAIVYSFNYDTLHVVPPPLVRETRWFIFTMGLGVVLRVMSDASGAVLQTQGRIALDNLLQAATEVLWTIACAGWVFGRGGDLTAVGVAFLIASAALAIVRAERVARMVALPRAAHVDAGEIGRLLLFGVMVMFSQSAEFLYAPVDYIIINRLLAPEIVAYYAPALQIDGALLLLVTAVGAVLLPKAAVAHTSGNLALVRQYYIRGTLLTTAVLLAAAGLTVLLSKWIFQIWLGNEMDPTRAILPGVMLHTVMGGSSAVGRSILIGMGKIWQYTTAVLIAGVMNMVLAFVFVRYLDWGLWGIVIATNTVVFTRAVLWQPWYVMRVLKAGNPSSRQGD